MFWCVNTSEVPKDLELFQLIASVLSFRAPSTFKVMSTNVYLMLTI